jgi:hypothetical protein
MFDSRQDRVTRHHPVSYRQIACETLPVIPTLTILRLSAASFELSRKMFRPLPTAWIVAVIGRSRVASVDRVFRHLPLRRLWICLQETQYREYVRSV